MSRIGRLPISLNTGVSATFVDGTVTVKGPLGTLSREIANKNIEVTIEGNTVTLTRKNEAKETKAAHGLYRALVYNMVVGVEKGYEKRLMIAGVGYKAVAQGEKVVLSLGYSHTIDVVAPKGLKLSIAAPTELVINGIDKELVGQFAADIKSLRKPEPYHGYGIRYKDETILRKQGKATGKK